MSFQEHADQEVEAAIIRLCDALCMWERSTGRNSVLIIREKGGFVFRAASGKPCPDSNDDIDDATLTKNILQT